MSDKAYSIEQMKGSLKKDRGFASSNMYHVKLPSLAGAVKANGGVLKGFSSRDLNIFCKATSIPGRQITTLDRQIGMTATKVAYGYIVPEVALTFQLTNTYAVRKYFDAWQELAVSNEPPYESGWFGDYSKSVVISQLRKPDRIDLFNIQGADLGLPSILTENLPTIGGIDIGDAVSGGNISFGFTSQENIVYSTELLNAFPTSMTDITVSNELNQISEFSVSLSYKNWVNAETTENDTFADTVNDAINGAIGAVGNVVGGVLGF